MLYDEGLSLQLWLEACNVVVYLHNRSPHIILDMITPKEVFSRRKLDVSHIIIFGAIVYCHAYKDSRKKLEPTIEMGIFVGYIETPNNYSVYFPSIKVIVVKQYVKFDEEKTMRFSLE